MSIYSVTGTFIGFVDEDQVMKQWSSKEKQSFYEDNHDAIVAFNEEAGRLTIKYPDNYDVEVVKVF